MKNSVLVLLMLISISVAGQVDSLERKLPQLKGVEKAIAYTDIITFYVCSDLKRALMFVEEARRFGANENNQVVKAYTFLSQGLYTSTSGQLDSATYYMEAAKQTGIQSKDDLVVIRACQSLGKNYIVSGKPEKALENLFEALRLLDVHPDKQTEMKTQVNIMWAYLELKRHKDCVDFGRASIKAADPKLEWITLYMYNNIAISYGALGKLDSAKYFIEKGMTSAKANEDFQSLANGYFILGTIYANSNRPDLAIQEYLKAKPYREKVGNPSFIVSDLYTIASLYEKTGAYKKGVDAGLEALKVADQYKLTLKFEGVYEALARNYEGLHDYKNSSRYFGLWAVAKDSIYKIATADAIAETATKYQSEKKQQQIVVQRAQLAEQKAEIRNTYLIIAALTIISVLGAIIFFLTKSRAKRKNELLRKENEVLIREAYIEATIQSQESERKRFARDLHDSIGQLISSLRLLLPALDRAAPIEEKIAVVSKSEKILDEMHKEIRLVAFNLMPQTLIQLGLLPALEEMVMRINQSDKVRMTVRGFDFPERLSEIQEISLYRIIQEWTTNTLKYSNASKIDIQLVGHEDEVNITVENDGDGFDIALLTKGEGNGWKNIQSRLNLIKGIVEIDSRPEAEGTIFIIQMPLIAERINK